MLVTIPVSADYKITVDKYNWSVIRLGTVQDKKSKNYGKPIESFVSHNHNIEGALRSMLNDTLRRDGVPEEDKKNIGSFMDWYMKKQEALRDSILSKEALLREAIELNGVM